MKKSRFSDNQIIGVLKQSEDGTPVPELCREHGVSSATLYKWRAKCGGMDASLMGRMKKLEEDNWRLKKWLPSVGYRTVQEAHRDISYYLMRRYNWIRPHQFNAGLAPAIAEEKLKSMSGFC